MFALVLKAVKTFHYMRKYTVLNITLINVQHHVLHEIQAKSQMLLKLLIQVPNFRHTWPCQGSGASRRADDVAKWLVKRSDR